MNNNTASNSSSSDVGDYEYEEQLLFIEFNNFENSAAYILNSNRPMKVSGMFSATPTCEASDGRNCFTHKFEGKHEFHVGTNLFVKKGNSLSGVTAIATGKQKGSSEGEEGRGKGKGQAGAEAAVNAADRCSRSSNSDSSTIIGMSSKKTKFELVEIVKNK